ncbi:REP-associated tyrosine transposase [Reichenbachiella sp.]|uniref:REP-associated tyrosine transposase n=1 Tax=Reichenbachiella sp. TaxID=2184521 RepID=UPI003B5ABDDA
MSEKYKANLLGELYFITITVVDWVDVLTRPVYKEIIIESLKYCQSNKGLNVHAYVIMSNHWHAIVSSNDTKLGEIMRDLKKFTSKRLLETIGQINESRREWMLKKFEYAAKRVRKGVNYKVWQDGYHPVHLSTNEMIDQRLNYIHLNPVEEGYVYEPKHYVYSSAKDYAGLPGLFVLQMLT